MVKWSDVSRGRDAGGLGIRRLSDVNLCLLVKWWWRFGSVNRGFSKDILLIGISPFEGNCFLGRWKIVFSSFIYFNPALH